MFYSVLIAIILAFTGATFLWPLLRDHPLLFLGYWAVCVSITFLAVLLAFAVKWGLRRTRAGREVVLIGQNPVACAAVRIPVARRLVLTLLLSGACAGLASTGTVLGYKGYYEMGLGAGAGFGGIAVALLGRSSALGLLLSALFFGTLQQGGLAINAHVPREIMDVLEGMVIVAVSLGDARVRGALLGSVTSGAT